MRERISKEFQQSFEKTVTTIILVPPGMHLCFSRAATTKMEREGKKEKANSCRVCASQSHKCYGQRVTACCYRWEQDTKDEFHSRPGVEAVAGDVSGAYSSPAPEAITDGDKDLGVDCEGVGDLRTTTGVARRTRMRLSEEM